MIYSSDRRAKLANCMRTNVTIGPIGKIIQTKQIAEISNYIWSLRWRRRNLPPGRTQSSNENIGKETGKNSNPEVAEESRLNQIKQSAPCKNYNDGTAEFHPIRAFPSHRKYKHPSNNGPYEGRPEVI